MQPPVAYLDLVANCSSTHPVGTQPVSIVSLSGQNTEVADGLPLSLLYCPKRGNVGE